jgi:uncharacterized protein YycO
MVVQLGDILLFKSRGGPLDRIIAETSKSEWVHCGYAISDRFYIEAVIPVIRIAPIDVQRKPDEVVTPKYIYENSAYEAAKAMILKIGTPYDLLGVLDTGTTKIFPTWADRLQAIQNFYRQQYYYCSELLAVHAMPHIEGWHSNRYVTPADIAKFLLG